MGGKMTAFLYFALLILLVVIGFTVFRRPVYEALYGTDMEVYEIVAGNGIASQVNAAYEITRKL